MVGGLAVVKTKEMWFSNWDMEENQEQAGQEPAASSKGGMGMWVVLAVVGVVLVVGGVLLAKKAIRPQEVEEKTAINQTAPVIEEAPEATSEVTTEETGVAKEVVVEGSSYKFVPNVIKVKKGELVRVTFKNAGGMHDFVIDELDVRTNQISDGEEEEVEFVADKAGTFEYYCSVGKHRAMGMVGKLIVE